MTTLMNWLSPSAMQSLGWALLHFLWQGTALAALAAACDGLVPSRVGALSAGRCCAGADAAGSTGDFLFLFATAFRCGRHREVVAARRGSLVRQQRAERAASGSAQSFFPCPFAGCASVAGRGLASGRGFLQPSIRRRIFPAGARTPQTVDGRRARACLRFATRCKTGSASSARLTYCECKWLQAPAVIGWFRPVVFLPVTALTGLSEEQLEAVIAHELAHIQRLDPFVNVFQVCVETLLFYHPAVWWLNKRIRAEREHCCDDMAVALCGNAVEYARALTLMEEWRSAPVFAMAANRGPLTERIVRVLGLKTLGAGMRGIGLTGSVLCLSAALVAGNALLGMAHPRPVAGGSSQASGQASTDFPTAGREQYSSAEAFACSSAKQRADQPSVHPLLRLLLTSTR